MAKNKENYYFRNFLESSRISSEAADKLKDVLNHYDCGGIEADLAEIHEIERKGDDKRHEITAEIVKAFITPIDRDDIIRISQCVDNVTDAIEDIVLGLYTWNVTEIRPDAIEFADLLIRCCKTLEKLLEDFSDYKRSKTIMDSIVAINQLEEEGDRLYIRSLRRLCEEPSDFCTVMAWREIYRSFEKGYDCCEDVGDVIEAILVANT